MRHDPGWCGCLGQVLERQSAVSRKRSTLLVTEGMSILVPEGRFGQYTTPSTTMQMKGLNKMGFQDYSVFLKDWQSKLRMIKTSESPQWPSDGRFLRNYKTGLLLGTFFTHIMKWMAFPYNRCSKNTGAVPVCDVRIVGYRDRSVAASIARLNLPHSSLSPHS